MNWSQPISSSFSCMVLVQSAYSSVNRVVINHGQHLLQCSEPGWLVRQGVGSSPTPASMSSQVSACYEIKFSGRYIGSACVFFKLWQVITPGSGASGVWWELPVWITDGRGQRSYRKTHVSAPCQRNPPAKLGINEWYQLTQVVSDKGPLNGCCTWSFVIIWKLASTLYIALRVFESGEFLFSASCFDRFFRHVNLKENKLISKRRGGFFMDDLNLIGVDYLWRVSYILITVIQLWYLTIFYWLSNNAGMMTVEICIYCY